MRDSTLQSQLLQDSWRGKFISEKALDDRVESVKNVLRKHRRDMVDNNYPGLAYASPPFCVTNRYQPSMVRKSPVNKLLPKEGPYTWWQKSKDDSSVEGPSGTRRRSSALMRKDRRHSISKDLFKQIRDMEGMVKKRLKGRPNKPTKGNKHVLNLLHQMVVEGDAYEATGSCSETPPTQPKKVTNRGDHIRIPTTETDSDREEDKSPAEVRTDEEDPEQSPDASPTETKKSPPCGQKQKTPVLSTGRGQWAKESEMHHLPLHAVKRNPMWRQRIIPFNHLLYILVNTQGKFTWDDVKLVRKLQSVALQGYYNKVRRETYLDHVRFWDVIEKETINADHHYTLRKICDIYLPQDRGKIYTQYSYTGAMDTDKQGTYRRIQESRKAGMFT